MNAPPALGVWNPIETEPDNTVTSLYQHAHMQRWSDPYLTDAAKFGRGPNDIPPGDPGSMGTYPSRKTWSRLLIAPPRLGHGAQRSPPETGRHKPQPRYHSPRAIRGRPPAGQPVCRQ